MSQLRQSAVAAANGMQMSHALLRLQILLVLAAALGLTAGTGCSRTRYRLQADREVNCLVDQKAMVVGTAPGALRIGVNPLSRMYDPFNPDCEPMPPDDPLSHRYMNCVDCKKGSKDWRRAPHTPFVESPAWKEHLPFDESGNVVLNQQSAVQMALMQSTRYQRQLEELYLSALDVTFERFRFDTQFFGGSDIFFTADGRDRSGTGSSSSLLEVNVFRPGNRLRMEKLSATGGELVVGLANSLVWQFAGPDDYSSNTILDFALVQPLLRAGGRTRVLERLTISERSLLANVRIMERYRRGFYLSILNGRDPGQGPSRRGGIFGGAGLEGFSGVGGGGFGRLGGGGGGFTGGAGAAGANGFIGLLQTSQQIQNQRSNVVALRDSVEQLKASNSAGRIDRFQVDLAQQALYNAQSQLLNSDTAYQATLDGFKTTLGLPPDLPLELKDPLLDQFQLLDPDLTTLRSSVTDLLNALREKTGEGTGDEPDEEVAKRLLPEGPILQLSATSGGEEITIGPSPETSGMESDGNQQALRRLKAAFDAEWQVVKQDVVALNQQLPKRRKGLQRLAVRSEVEHAHIDPALFNAEGLGIRARTIALDLEKLEKQFTQLWARLEELSAEESLAAPQRKKQLVSLLTDLSGRLLELSIVQARARLDGIAFDTVELTSEQALQIASFYRRDWANARASLVDSWRLIHFNANDLMSDMSILFSGDIGNVGQNPLRLRNTRGRLRVGLQFDAPLTRKAERNVYRQSLIEYQQARRSFYQFRDGIHQQLRNTIRQIRLNELNFELRRAAVLVAISQVDLTQLRLSEPPKPGETSELGATTARDLVQSLSDLLNVQNDFLSVWVSYEVQRANLEFDLGIMELDDRGMRVEHGLPLEAFLVPACGGGSFPPDLEGHEIERLPPIEFLPSGPSDPSEESEMLPIPLKSVLETPELGPASYGMRVVRAPAAEAEEIQRLPTISLPSQPVFPQ